MIDPSARIHSTADLEPDVRVGARTSIWHRAQVRTGARIGAECVLGRDAFIDSGVVVGDRVKVQNQALIYHGVTIEDGVFVGPNAILTNDRHPRAVTTTGDLASAEDWTVSPILLRRGCSVGAGAVVVAGVEVGVFAMIGAGAVVTRDVSDYALVAGSPARRLGWVCACGRRLTTVSSGEPAPPVLERDDELVCGACERTYVYVTDTEALEPQLAAPKQGVVG